jgi:hypothetical protein
MEVSPGAIILYDDGRPATDDTRRLFYGACLETAMNTLTVGGATIEHNGSLTRFAIPPTTRRAYADAQWYDYRGLRRSKFPHRPPTRLSLRARFSHEAADLGGTAGFGFWNDPFTLSGGGILAAPNALWFFAGSPPNDHYLCEGVPGRGWKAASLNTGRWPPLLVAPAAVPAVLLTRVPGLGRPIMKLARRMIKAQERMLEVKMIEWHHYELDWDESGAVFRVDGAEVHRAPDPPAIPLGFVMWIDSQYAVASETGDFGFGLIEHPQTRWMEIENLSIT